MFDADTFTTDTLAQLRKKLLDLSKANPLVAYKMPPIGKAGRGFTIRPFVRLVNSSLDDIFASLDFGQKLLLKHLPEENEFPAADENTPHFATVYDEIVRGIFDFRLTSSSYSPEAFEGLSERNKARIVCGLPLLNYKNPSQADLEAIAIAHGIKPDLDLPTAGVGKLAVGGEASLNSMYLKEHYSSCLTRIDEKYRSNERETGIHTLFVALGFLQWSEPGSEIRHHAPILLMPVRLSKHKQDWRNQWALERHDDPIELNATLVELLLENWGIVAPHFKDGQMPSDYLALLTEAVKREEKLSIRTYATLGMFPFSRIVLWKDLDPAAWHQGAFTENRLVSSLLGGTSSIGSPSSGVALDIDLLEETRSIPPLIAPADASQHAAIMDAVSGESMVIEGPPGTGKSQTITNIIGAALRQGKRVLFVAEKQAALSVVANRLRDAGLGPLLLELHGDTVRKDMVNAALAERLQLAAPNPSAIKIKRDLISQRRNFVRRYMSLIGAPVGSLGLNAFHLLWRHVALKNALGQALVQRQRYFSVDGFANLTAAELSRHRDVLKSFGEAFDSWSQTNASSKWVNARRLSAFDQTRELAAAQDCADAAARCADIEARIRDIGFDFWSVAADAENLLTLASELADACFGPEHTLVLQDPDSVEALHQAMLQWRGQVEDIEVDVASYADAKVTFTGSEQKLPVYAAETYQRKQAFDHLTSELARHLPIISEVRRALEVNGILAVSRFYEIVDLTVRLLDVSADVAVFQRAEIMEPEAQALFAKEKAKADAINSELLSLHDRLAPAALEEGASRLEEWADTLAGTGLFGRMSRDYRLVTARVASVVKADGLDTAGKIASLRAAAVVLKKQDAFRETSPAKALFPSGLWDGVHSNWEALANAIQSLEATRNTFGAIGAVGVMRNCLKIPYSDRSELLSNCQTIAPVRALLGEFADMGWDDLVLAADTEKLFLDGLTQALLDVGMKPSGMLVRLNRSIFDRIAQARSLEQACVQMQQRFGDDCPWNMASAPQTVRKAFEDVQALKRHQTTFNLVSVLAEPEGYAKLNAVLEVLQEWHSALRDWVQKVDQFAAMTGFEPLHETMRWEKAAEFYATLAADVQGVKASANLLKHYHDVKANNLSRFGDMVLARDGVVTCAAEQLPNFYEFTVMDQLVRYYIGDAGADLQTVTGMKLEEARARYVALDEELQRLEALDILAQRCRDEIPDGIDYGPKSAFTDGALVKHFVSTPNARLTLRDLVGRAKGALLQMKPVWMMSPTSVAQFIRPGTIKFDLLVIDEASQMRPEFAIPAIMRANQLIVVGDANQLPPNDLFNVAITDGAANNVQEKSILDLAAQRIRNTRMLKWHYRSKHESLIQFSNQQFYRGELIVFPSASIDDDLLGIRSTFVEGVYHGQINAREAEALLSEMLQLMQRYPQYTMGIVAMNAPQTELLKSEFAKVRDAHLFVRDYVERHGDGIDMFFIKNIENVQGDQRDIILISTVYGPERLGGPVMQRFTAINNEGGWRRLNVLVTRASLSTRLFTSLRPSDVVAEKGVNERSKRAFQAYLSYAAAGPMVSTPNTGSYDSDFERFVAERLQTHGYEVDCQVGVNGFRIDLAVKYPGHPHMYIAGIECDGSRWHSGLSVRDRDSIRQKVLEDNGWRIHRIWSTDWFADSDSEMAKLLAKLEAWKAEMPVSKAKLVASPVKVVVEDGQVSKLLIDATAMEDDETGEGRLAHPGSPAGGSSENPTLVRQAPAKLSPQGAQQKNPSNTPEALTWYERIKGLSYDVYFDGRLVGEIEKRPKSAGAKVTEYDVLLAETDDSFVMNDIYAAVREIAARVSVPA